MNNHYQLLGSHGTWWFWPFSHHWPIQMKRNGKSISSLLVSLEAGVLDRAPGLVSESNLGSGVFI